MQPCLRLTLIALTTVLAASCTSPAKKANAKNGDRDVNSISNSAPNGRTNDQSTTNNDINSGFTNSRTNGGEACSAIDFDESTSTPLYYDCRQEDDNFECECNGELHTSHAATCEDALREECGVSDREIGACRASPGAICWETADSTLSCLCEGASELVDTEETACRVAAWRNCATSCSVDGTDCAPTIEPEPGYYACDCAYYGASRSAFVGDDTCEEAVEVICEPGSFRGGCTGWKGFCDQVGSPEFGFDCVCLDGSTQFVTPDDLGGVDDCERALVMACGENTPPDGYFCEAEVDGSRGECLRDEDEQGNTVYDCYCVETSAMNASGGEVTVETDDCETALQEACNL